LIPVRRVIRGRSRYLGCRRVGMLGTPPTKYSWLGASGISAEFSSGTTASDGTGYVPQLGRPLQTQPITPPGANAGGTWANGPYAGPSESWTGESGAAWGAESTMRQVARQKKAEEEAARKSGRWVSNRQYVCCTGRRRQLRRRMGRRRHGRESGRGYRHESQYSGSEIRRGTMRQRARQHGRTWI
jgi:hypothetical protein